MQRYLEIIASKYINKGITVIIEGIHLDPEFLTKMMSEYG